MAGFQGSYRKSILYVFFQIHFTSKKWSQNFRGTSPVRAINDFPGHGDVQKNLKNELIEECRSTRKASRTRVSGCK